MSYNQIRSAGKHRTETHPHSKPFAQRQTDRTIRPSWRQHHDRSQSMPSAFGQGRPVGSHHVTYPPMQALQNESNPPWVYPEYHRSESSSFDNGNVFRTLHRADNRGYTDQEYTRRPISMPFENEFSTRGHRVNYPPPVQTLQTASNRPHLSTEFHGSELSSFDNFQTVHRTDNRGYIDVQESKRLKTEFSYLSAPTICPLALPPTRSLITASMPTFESFDRRQNTESSSRRAGEPSSPKLTHNQDEGGAAVVSEPSNDDSSISTFTNEHPRLLALPEDTSHLTALHCFVRRHCVYIFCAKAHEVDVPRKGRKKPLALGQIGIGCVHCKGSQTKLKGCSYFPSSISGIYNATMIIQQRHFPVCPSVTKEVYGEYNKLKGLTARSASTKEYWISSAKKLGMIDTKDGVFFRSMLSDNESKISSAQTKSFDGCRNKGTSKGQSIAPLRSLVEPSDRVFATEYAYFVMSQMTTCTFTEADRLGKRKGHSLGFPGLACKYCYGGNGSGRFFPLTLKTFSDVSKSLHVLRNHLVKCAKAPAGLASKVSTLFEQHNNDKDTTPFGSQKIFFDHIWRRLHPELSNGPAKVTSQRNLLDKAEQCAFPVDATGNRRAQPHLVGRNDDSLDAEQSSVPLKNSSGANGNLELGSSVFDSVDMPPLSLTHDLQTQFENNGTSPETFAMPSSCISNDNDTTAKRNLKHRGPAKKRYLELYYHGNSEPDTVQYSDADVSVAMILATGMGKQDQSDS
eukprot:CCRYP_014890-RA/>CCRYP_014890-RA protein AED:0.05 eAED:0.05 QI:2273/1/1/1/0.88/0.8/10/195/741